MATFQTRKIDPLSEDETRYFPSDEHANEDNVWECALMMGDRKAA